MWLLTIRDLTHRATRFVVVILATAMVFTLLFLMTGLVEQFNQEPYLAVDAFGDQTWVVPAGVSGPITATSTLDPTVATNLEAEGLEPVLVARGTLTVNGVRHEAVVIGLSPQSEVTPKLVSGDVLTGGPVVVVDESTGAAVGDVVRVSDTELRVAGISGDTTLLAGQPLVFMNLPEARDTLFGGAPVTSAMLGTPGSLPPGTQTLTPNEVAADALGPLESAISSIDLIRLLLWAVAAIIIGAVVYLSALERSRDFAVMRAVGAPIAKLGGSLALQALAIAIVAVGVAAVLQFLVVPVFPLKVRVPVRSLWQLPLLAVAVSLVAAFGGMRRVRRTDPAQAFAGPGS
ncbi:MAG TPA: ABC transporter permease [Acidimicrobiia bacterium]|nr:ABC transporter permease [Acidimicrobiia bacterium]